MLSEVSQPKLGIIAGDGDLPVKLVQACRNIGREVFVVIFNKSANPYISSGVDYVCQSIGAVGKIIQVLKDAQCIEIVLAGPIKRPKFSEIGLDSRGAAMLPRLLSAKGDDGLLSIVINELENEGFKVVGADDVLNELLAKKGIMGSYAPKCQDWADIERGIDVVRALGAVDVGQAAVVYQGYILGVEAAEGTNNLINRIVALRQSKEGGVLVKLRKPGQDRRADLPTIGVETVAYAISAQLSGIAVEAQDTLIIDQDRVIKLADEAGLFIVGVTKALRSAN